jgi:hypothetical protein
MKKVKTTNEPRKILGKFVPNIKNFEVSLSYEGITARDNRVAVSLESLKLKYAR